jgi:uncharacterized repeat protein (TIGR01451 family)
VGAAIVIAFASGLGVIMHAAQQPAIPPAPAATPAPEAGTAAPGAGALDTPPQDVAGTSGRVRVLIELQQAPAAVTFAGVLEQAAVRTPQTIAAAATAARTQLTAINAQQQQVGAAIAAAPANATELYRVQRAMNGIAAMVNANSLAALRLVPGVKAVHRLELEYLNNSTSVPFVGAPAVWAGTSGVPIAATGAGIRIGIIDSGVDYQHATFGGNGLLADYQANDRTVAPDTYFPTAKVVGGMDFVGDAYTGSTAVPDPDPMDCNGHGTHVAATAAGYGVNANGTTFAGPYGPSSPFAALRIGPGTAPQASIYALRVFGCGGGTSHTVQAIDWAMDPNGDNDLSDHLDVINMSLGGAFGGLTDTTAIASDNAARAGVIVVSSAGNSGDTYFVTGAPGTASRTISTAAIVDGAGVGSPMIVNAPGGVAGEYEAGNADFGGPPPAGGITGNVVIGLDPNDGAGALTTDACSPLTNAGAVAGNIALVDRGNCEFDVKTKNAQNAGAIAVILVNNAAGAPNITGDDTTIVIPTAVISQADGTTLRAQIPGLNVTLHSEGDTIGSFTSRGPRSGSSGSGPIALKPDIAAPGVLITSAQTGVVCTGGAGSAGCIVADVSGFRASSQTLTLNGTSMAAPHMAGIMALMRQLHPTWTVEELKALVMNRALHDITTGPGGLGDRFGPARIGAGRVDAALAAQSSVVAFNADTPGLVSVSFDIPEVVSLSSQTKTFRVVNHGTTAQTYQLAIDTVTDAPGVAFMLPGVTSITVQPGTTVDVPVRVDANAAQMDRVRDVTVSATQAIFGNPASLTGLEIPRHWLTEESGYVTLSQGGVTRLRVPVYAAARPAAAMSGASTIVTGGAPTGATTIPLSGSDTCTGTLGAGPTCIGGSNDIQSLVSPFELQVVSPRDTNLPAQEDLQYAGVATDGNRIWFGVSMWGDWASPSDTNINIYIDNDLNGTYERVIATTNTGALSRILFGEPAQDDTDVFITTVLTPPNLFSNVLAAATPNYVNGLDASVIDTALYNSNVLFFGATPSQLGLANTNTPFRYRIVTCPGFLPLCQQFFAYTSDVADGPFFWNGAAQGLNFSGALLSDDLNGSSLPVTWNTANLTTNGSLGALLLHHHNTTGQRAQVVPLDTAQRTDLSLTMNALPAAPASGQQTVLTVTVTNNGPNTANGVTIATDLPLGLTHVSDDGGGAYVAYATWTVPGALASGASATLHITVTADDTDFMQARAMVSTVTQIDPVAANNQAVLTFNAPAQTDLRITSAPVSSPVVAGNAFGSTITVTNQGAWPAHNVLITNAITGFNGTIQAGTPTAGVFSVGTDIWQIATLGAGASATLNLSGVANGGPTLNLQSSVGSGVADTNSGNNLAIASFNVAARATSAAAAAGAAVVVPGQGTTLTVVVTDAEATGTKTNPGGGVSLSSSVPSDVFSNVNCTLAPVAATTDQSSCTVTVTPAATGVRTLTATYNGSLTHLASNATRDLTAEAAAEPTAITAANATAVSSLAAQDVTLIANVVTTGPVNIEVDAGTVTFTVRDASNAAVGVPVTVPVVANGAVSATYVLPANTPAQTLTITAAYSGTALFTASTDATKTLTVTAPETLTYMLAEGATGTFFDLDVLLANPNNIAAPVTITFLKEDGSTITLNRTLDPLTRTTIRVDDLAGIEGTVVSTVVTSTSGVPLVVERTMKWDATGYGAHAEKATAGPASTWYFAEGSQGYFSTFLLLANPEAAPNTAHVTYFREGEPPLVRDYDLLPSSRFTVNAANDSELVDRAFGIEVKFDQPGLAERSTYFGTNPFWSGGHASAGSTAPATQWFLAEGATGSFFATFVLLANPNDLPAQVTMTYLPDNGTPVTTIHDVPAKGRKTINIAFEDPTLANAAIGFRATSDRPIVVERAQYWPQPVWHEGHASAGVTEAATRWGLAEGRVGGASNDQTYVLLANAGTEEASVTISFLRTSGTPVIKVFKVPAGSRRNVAVNGAGGDVPELSNEQFGAVIESTAPIFVERSVYSDAGGVTWAAGTNATATKLP